MWINKEKFEKMEQEAKKTQDDKEFWENMSNNWSDVNHGLIKEKAKIRKDNEQLKELIEHRELNADIIDDEYRRAKQEIQHLKDINDDLYDEYLDTLDKNDLLQKSLTLSIEALKESQKQINNLKQERDLLNNDLNTSQSDKKYYKELYLREIGY